MVKITVLDFHLNPKSMHELLCWNRKVQFRLQIISISLSRSQKLEIKVQNNAYWKDIFLFRCSSHQVYTRGQRTFKQELGTLAIQSSNSCYYIT